MTLAQLLSQVPDCTVTGPADTEVRRIHIDSRLVKPGDVFVAIRGNRVDGHDYISSAVDTGAVAVVYECGQTPESATAVKTSSSPEALAQIAAAFEDRPADRMRMVGITGTNGKTSTAFLTSSVFETAGLQSAMIGTVLYRCGGQEFPARLTTPDALEIHALLPGAVDAGDQWCVLEASSHALEQQRLHGIEFDIAVFTNLSRDHLDYHGDYDSYIQAKAQLFRQIKSAVGHAVVNIDDQVWQQVCSPDDHDTLTYGLVETADLYPVEWTAALDGIRATLRTPLGSMVIHSPLVGAINLYNILAAAGCGIAAGLNRESIADGIAACRRIPGRMERVDTGSEAMIFVDFAHTPDAVHQILKTVRMLTTGRIITVLGCGGNRDTGKRSQMGAAAAERSDLVILTSDNPRSEDPEAIIQAMLTGIEQRDQVRTEPDRRQAISLALQEAQRSDIVLILGKGHETTQTIHGRALPFDDRSVARELAGHARHVQ